MMVSTVWLVFCLLFFYTHGAPLCKEAYGVGGNVKQKDQDGHYNTARVAYDAYTIEITQMIHTIIMKT